MVKKIREYNKYLLLILIVFTIFIVGLTSYAIFRRDYVSDNTISLGIDDPYTQASCFLTSGSTTLTITGYRCFAGNSFGLPTITDVIIPKKISGKEITAIGNGSASCTATSTTVAFCNKGITSVVLPDTLLTIGNYSFNNNKMTGQLIIPDNVTSIGTNTFQGNSSGTANRISNVILGNSVQTIGISAFDYNQLTGTLTVPNSVTSIGNYAFRGTSDGLTNKITSLTLGSSVQTIGDYAFDYNQLTGTLTVPNSVTVIGSYAFRGTLNGLTNKISSLSLGSSVQTIGTTAFRDNQLSGHLSIPNSVQTIGSYAFANNQLTSVALPINPNFKRIENYLFSGNQITGHLAIPDSVEYIGSSTFPGTSTNSSNKITSLTLGSSVQTIGDNAFSIHHIQGALVIPNSVETIGTAAFFGQTTSSISSLTLGDHIISIGDRAFSQTKVAGTLVIPNSVTTIGTDAFAGGLLTNVKLGTGVTSIGDTAFHKNTGNQNPGLVKIINPTGRSFSWGNITNAATKPQSFVTGTISHGSGNISVTAS